MITAEGSYPTVQMQTLRRSREGNRSWNPPPRTYRALELLQELLQWKRTNDSEPLLHDPTGGKNNDLCQFFGQSDFNFIHQPETSIPAIELLLR